MIQQDLYKAKIKLEKKLEDTKKENINKNKIKTAIWFADKKGADSNYTIFFRVFTNSLFVSFFFHNYLFFSFFWLTFV